MTTIKLSQALEYFFDDYNHGTTFWVQFGFYQTDDDTLPTDLTGSTFKFELCRDEDCEPCVRPARPEILTIGDGIEISGADNNLLTISKVLTSPPGRYRQSLIGTDSNGKVTAWEKGILKISPIA